MLDLLRMACYDMMHFLALDLRHLRATPGAWEAGTERVALCGVVADTLLVVNGVRFLSRLPLQFYAFNPLQSTLVASRKMHRSTMCSVVSTRCGSPLLPRLCCPGVNPPTVRFCSSGRLQRPRTRKGIYAGERDPPHSSRFPLNKPSSSPVSVNKPSSSPPPSGFL
jgi:hypothetical protein